MWPPRWSETGSKKTTPDLFHSAKVLFVQNYPKEREQWT